MKSVVLAAQFRRDVSVAIGGCLAALHDEPIAAVFVAIQFDPAQYLDVANGVGRDVSPKRPGRLGEINVIALTW